VLRFPLISGSPRKDTYEERAKQSCCAGRLSFAHLTLGYWEKLKTVQFWNEINASLIHQAGGTIPFPHGSCVWPNLGRRLGADLKLFIFAKLNNLNMSGKMMEKPSVNIKLGRATCCYNYIF